MEFFNTIIFVKFYTVCPLPLQWKRGIKLGVAFWGEQFSTSEIWPDKGLVFLPYQSYNRKTLEHKFPSPSPVCDNCKSCVEKISEYKNIYIYWHKSLGYNFVLYL